MGMIQADLELALLHLHQLEQRIAEQRERIGRLKEIGGAITNAEDFLLTLQDSLELVKLHIARITDPEKASNISV